MRRCVRARTRAMCGHTCACACEIHSGKCTGCVCVRLVLDLRCATALLHTFRNKIARKMLLFVLKTILVHSIPFYNISFCSRTLKMLKNCWKKIKELLKNFEQLFKSAGACAKCDHLKFLVRTRVRAHLNLEVRGACVRPKKGSQLIPW